MTIDEMIKSLETIRDKIGGKEEVPVVRINYGENEYMIPSYATIGDFKDQDGNEFKCALIAEKGGEEFTEKNTHHWEWKPDKIRT